MTDISRIVRRYGPTVLVIAGISAGVVAGWIFQFPAWLLVIGLVILIFVIISLLGDLGLFGGHDPE